MSSLFKSFSLLCLGLTFLFPSFAESRPETSGKPPSEAFNRSQIFFSQIDSNVILPHATVTSIEQDKQGFIWFGTQGGLVKFDGHKSKTYDFTFNNKGKGISNWILDLYTDSEDRIWVASGASISLYQSTEDKFKHFILSDIDSEIKNDMVMRIVEDYQNNVWFLTLKSGAIVLNSETNQFKLYGKKYFPNNNTEDFSSIATGRDGAIYIVTQDGRLLIRDPETEFFKEANLNGFANDMYKSIFLDEQQNIWIGTKSQGAFFLNKDLKVQIPGGPNNAQCHGEISEIIQDKSGTIWLATNNGLCSYSHDTKSIVKFQKNSFAKSSLLNNHIHSVMQDDGGVIWVGTQNGVNYWNAAFPSFQHVNKQGYQTIQSEHTISFAEDSKGNFFVGSWGGGIVEFSADGETSALGAGGALDEILAAIVPSLYVDTADNIWIGTLRSGLYKSKLGSDKFQNFRAIEGDLHRFTGEEALPTITHDTISRIKQLSDGRMAFATWGGGLVLTEDGSSFELLAASNSKTNIISSTYISDMVEDEDRNLWIGTNHGGLNRFNLDTGENVVFEKDLTNPQALKSDSVYALLNTEDYIWMTTPDAGIARLDKEKLKIGEVVFQHFGTAEGLGSDFTYGILQDDNNYIWVSHSKGLTRLNPYTLRSINFNTSHGLQGSDFNSGAFFKASDGRMFFGGANGFNTFLPEQVPINTYKPPIRLTKFSQSNEERPIHELFKEDGVLELKHNETVVDFEFAALDYTKPASNQYKYKMEGLADVWIDLGTNNHIPFSHLDDGSYTLKVKGSNNDGVWSDELAIPIRVLPPIWRTWYAYLGYFLIASIIFLFLVRQQQLKIQRQISQERKLHKLAYFDSLTGLPNRQSFYESMEKFLSLAKRGNYNAGVMFIDLDRFKRINDTLGHNFGDKVLMEVAERLRHSVRNSDFVARNYDVKSFKNEIARLGGDEFTVFLSHIDNPEETTLVTQRIIDSVSKPIEVDGYEVSVTPSIGIAMYPENGLTVQELMKHADVAMYQAKEEGRRTFKFFSNALNEKAFERLQLEEHLRNALKNQEFELYYQPQVDLYENRIAKAEALIRWNHPVLGFVSPADFIPIAEESGLIVELGEWILQTACFQAKEWLDNGISDIRVSINVSSVQFKQTNLVDNVKNALALTGLPSNLLELELTESAVMSDVEDNIDRLQQLKNMGVTIAVDDFGTGYSSLSYLKKFPIDTLKIDRSFIVDIDNNENDAAIVKAIMLLAETMQLNVVAEGIETLEQLRVLDSYDCKYIQGYFFSRPLPYEAFVSFVGDEFQDKSTWKLDLIG